MPNLNTSNSVKICASYGAAGLGMLTDHSLASKHGYTLKDFSQIRNMGRGSFFYQFRSQILETLHLPNHPPVGRSDSARHIVTLLVDDDTTVVKGRLEKEQHSRKSLPQQDAFTSSSIQSIDSVSEDRLDESMIRQAVSSRIWISSGGNDSVWSALFLPRGSTLILLYDETTTVKGGRQKSNRPARKWSRHAAFRCIRAWYAGRPLAASGAALPTRGIHTA